MTYLHMTGTFRKQSIDSYIELPEYMTADDVGGCTALRDANNDSLLYETDDISMTAVDSIPTNFQRAGDIMVAHIEEGIEGETILYPMASYSADGVIAACFAPVFRGQDGHWDFEATRKYI
jgi:hypothetical protein